MDRRAVLAAFDEQIRRRPEYGPGTNVERDAHVVRVIASGEGWSGVTCEITAADVRAVLPDTGKLRSTMGAGLRSILTVLKARKTLFVNPIARIRTGSHERRDRGVELSSVPGSAMVQGSHADSDPSSL